MPLCPGADNVALSAEDATETIADAAAAFCVDDTVIGVGESAGLSKAELLAQSVPFDPVRALAVVQVSRLMVS